jgi:hypothetical protein
MIGPHPLLSQCVHLISVLMFELMVLRDEPFLRGMDVLLLELESSHQHKNENHNKHHAQDTGRRWLR